MALEPSADLEQLTLDVGGSPKLSPYLCDVCQQLDIRELLAQSDAQSSTLVKAQLTGLLEDFLEYKPGLPDFFQHHKSLGALQASAKDGCSFCKLICDSWFRSPERSATVDKAIDDAGQGQLLIGSSGHNVSKAEMPIIIVTQRPGGHSSRTLCTFDVFSERGEQTTQDILCSTLMSYRFSPSENFKIHRNSGRFLL
jgi:hypothetical protein